MAACTRVPWSKFWKNPRRCCHCWRSGRFVSQQSDVAKIETCIPKGQITIPKKKKRDSLSILKALASTVDQVKGPSYQDMDDPYLTTTKFDMFPCFMSKASGQKTARYFVNKYSSAFDHDDMAPSVKAFQPDNMEYQFTSLCDDAIRERVQRREVMKAVEVYEKMKQQGLEVSEEVKLELLELMCMFNSMDPPEKQYSQEMAFSIRSQDHQEPSVLAQDVFDDLAEKTEDAYNWMLQGHLMTNKGEPALYLYQEMKKNNIKLHQNSYHLLLSKASLMAYLSNSMMLETMKSMLQEMESVGMHPTLVTLQSTIKGFQKKPFLFLQFFPRYLAEMKKFGIEPDYQSWCLAMNAMMNCVPGKKNLRNPPSPSNVEQMKQYIRDSITHMKDHPQDIYFMPYGSYFEMAMNLCKYFEDSELALQVNDFKDSLGTKYIVTNINRESAYYYMLFDLVSRTESCDKVLAIYNKTYGQGWVDGETMQKVLNSVYAFKEYKHLPELMEDYLQRQPKYPENQVLVTFLSMMSLDNHPEELMTAFQDQARYLYSLMKQFFDELRKPRYEPSWTVAVHIIKIFLNTGDLNSAWECFMMCHKHQESLDHFKWNKQLLPLLTEIIDAKDQAKVEKFVSIAGASLNHVVDIDAFRPKLLTFMTKEDIDALQKSQRDRTRAKYDL